MGKLLHFPTNRIIRNSPRMPELSEEEQIDPKKEKFIEQLTDPVVNGYSCCITRKCCKFKK